MLHRVQARVFRVFAIAAAMLSLFSGTMTTIAFAHTVWAQTSMGIATLRASDIGTNSPSAGHARCAGGEWGWHFHLPGNAEFVSIEISFQSAGTITAFDARPNASHAYVITPGSDTVLGGTAVTTGNSNTTFMLSNVCSGTAVAPTAMSQPTATQQPIVVAPIETAQPTATPEPPATPEPTALVVVVAPIETAQPTATQQPQPTPIVVPTDIPAPTPEQIVIAPPQPMPGNNEGTPPSRPELLTPEAPVTTPAATQAPAAPEAPTARPTIVAPAIEAPAAPPAQQIEPEVVVAPAVPQVPAEAGAADERSAPATVADQPAAPPPAASWGTAPGDAGSRGREAVTGPSTTVDNPPSGSSWGTAPGEAGNRERVALPAGGEGTAEVAPREIRSELPQTGPNDVLFWLGATLAAAVMAVGCGIQSRQPQPTSR